MGYKTHIKSYITHITDWKGQEIREIVEILTDLLAGGLTRQNFNFFEAQGHFEVIIFNSRVDTKIFGLFK